MRVADYIVKRIVDAGVGHVFMVTGRGLLYLSDALAANKDITSISTHHEQGASYAAYAYSEKTRNLGVCFVSTGCASTNAITAVMCAWQDDVPVMVISGQNMLNETTYHTHSKIRTYGQQENDIIALVKPITKYATMLEKASDIGMVMDRALYEAKSGRKGPVWVDVPLDLQSAMIDEASLEHYIPEAGEGVHAGEIEPRAAENDPNARSGIDVSATIELLTSSKRPVLLIGSGVKGAESLVKKLVEKLDIPLTYDASVVDVYTDENRLSIGCVGSMSGTRAGNFAVQNADLIIAAGCRLSTMLTGTERDKFARGAKLIAVDIDKNELEENRFREDMLLYHCDPVKYMESILEAEIPHTEHNEWLEKCLHWKEVFPKNIYAGQVLDEAIDMYEVAEKLGKYSPDGATFITDAGIEELIFPTTLCVREGQRVIHPVSQGAMGFAIPAIIGASCASDEPVICIVGDGSIMMNLQELQTIITLKQPVKIFIINNDCYAVIRNRQKELFRKRTIGTDPSNGVTLPDYKKVAECFGFNYLRIADRDNLNEIQDVMKGEGAYICEIMCREDQQFLRNSYAFNAKHRLLRRTLEDQAPFLERDVIYNEMIVEPIEVE